MKDIINNLQKSVTRKIQLTIASNLISSKDDRKRVMHAKSDNVKITIHGKADKIIETLFESILSGYHFGLEKSMKSSDLIFGYIILLHYKCHKINLNRGESYKDSEDCVKSKKAKSKSILKNVNKCFQYATTFTLSDEEIRKNS